MSTWVTRLDAPGDGPALAVKDAIDVAGLPTLVACAAVELDAEPASADAACVAAMRAAGARVVGKTRLTELCFSADGRSEPPELTPVNPLDPARLPGGSSSGSAVAVATGEADVALGTDTGGSVRIPAACCGVAGLKTTFGRVSVAGVHPLTPDLDTVGPLAPDVGGLVAAMALLEPGFATEPPLGRVVRLRVGGVEPATDAAVDRALRDAGWTVRETHLPDWDSVDDAAGVLLMAGAGRALRHLLPRAELITPRTRDRIRRATEVTAEDEAGARATVETWRQRLLGVLDDDDALALPTLAGPAPLLADYRSRLTRLTVTFNALGWPGLAVPVPGEGSLPASLQLVGAPGTEERLLGLGATLPVWHPVASHAG